MALTKTPVTVLASGTSAAAGSTKAAPGADSGAIDVRGHYGSLLGWKITNGASAPGVAPTLTIQVSHDASKWYDYWNVGGDTVASSVNSNAIAIERAVMYVRVIVYGNTTNAVTVEAYLQAVTGL
jgi:hypothetical protein